MNVTIGVTRYGTSTLDVQDFDMGSLLADYKGSPITSGRIPLVAIIRWMRAIYGLAAVILAILAWRSPSILLGKDAAAVTRQTILMGVLANACVFGSKSSFADRYQGRVAWLLPLVALALLPSRFVGRRPFGRHGSPGNAYG